MNGNIKDLLTFKRMLTPVLVQIIFWLLTLMVIISAITSMFQKEFLMGLMALIVGPLVVRVGCEIVIVLFRIHDNVNDIRNKAMQ